MRLLLVICFCASLFAQPGVQPPIVFVHGNGDDATKWMGVMWLFESNGYPRHLLRPIRLTDPSARRDDTKPEPYRSSTVDQASELSAFVARTVLETKAPKVVLVGSSRGGMTIRNYLKNAGGAALVSHAILCGTPNHGVVAMDGNLDFEFNGKGHFLRQLNESSELVPGVKFLTIRSDTQDKYAQPNVGYNSPELRGAENVVLSGLDHREVAFHLLAFAEMYRFVTGTKPQQQRVVAEGSPQLKGLVTGAGNGAATNRPLAGVKLQVYALKPQSADREEKPLVDLVTSESGEWGPLLADAGRNYEFVLEREGRRITYFMSGFLRSSDVLNLRFVPVGSGAPGRLVVHRPQGYLSKGRDPMKLDGTEVEQLLAGIPTQDSVVLSLGAGQAKGVKVELRDEVIYARPAASADELNLVELIWE